MKTVPRTAQKLDQVESLVVSNIMQCLVKLDVKTSLRLLERAQRIIGNKVEEVKMSQLVNF